MAACWGGFADDCDGITQKVNESNAKRIAFGLLLIIFTAHGVNYYLHGRDTCKTLLEEGRYLGRNSWQPSGCMMHHYVYSETKRCVHQSHVTFIGDSRIRQLYFAYTRATVANPNTVEEGKVHEDIVHVEESTHSKVEFLWQPEVNDSMIEAFQQKILNSGSKPPDLVVVGGATWSIKLNNADPKTLEQYNINVTKLLPVMNQAKDKVIWMMQASVKEHLLADARKMITNEQIDLYNEAAENILSDSNVYLWRTARVSSDKSGDVMEDGLHVSKESLNVNVQLLLNFLCNSKHPPQATTCCTGETFQLNLLQITAFLFFTSCIVMSILLTCRRRSFVQSEESTQEEGSEQDGMVVIDPESGSVATAPSTKLSVQNYKLIVALAKFGLIMMYFYICDRTDIMPKENKYYHHLHFFVPLVYAAIVGVFFSRDVKKPTFMNVQQTTEWKGWMQIFILVYHVTGASSVLPIYMHIRILVACYIFLTAYGQFYSSWVKNQFGFVRVCTVICRQNLLVFFLCIVMDRQYQFYYFVPLVTFWYVLIYATMALPPRVTQESAQENSTHYLYIVIKLCCLLCVCVVLSMTEVFFYRLFNWWPAIKLFGWPGDSLYEWWFRWQLDRYIVPYGMTFALCYCTLQVTGRLRDTTPENLLPGGAGLVLVILGIIGVLTYTIHSFSCPSKPSCNSVHTYLSVFPITGFILLRNTLGYIRSRYSYFFAWFGTISLELFIGQYHVWLAQDTKGVLVLLPGFPSLNIAVSSFIFVFIAHEIASLTGEITKLVIPSETKELLKRLLMFVVLLLCLLGYSSVYDLHG
ncbi:N-acetylneuraminate (7)9-O-acetyltransferase-like [Amphiura filiformis]|uniref:N-acetylneuraminate (7)9-O-acetyltransferase-like n=1 Tax=Amphiura filiformis TaxID=82378 RepID=UPI003B2180B8